MLADCQRRSSRLLIGWAAAEKPPDWRRRNESNKWPLALMELDCRNGANLAAGPGGLSAGSDPPAAQQVSYGPATTTRATGVWPEAATTTSGAVSAPAQFGPTPSCRTASWPLLFLADFRRPAGPMFAARSATSAPWIWARGLAAGAARSTTTMKSSGPLERNAGGANKRNGSRRS